LKAKIMPKDKSGQKEKAAERGVSAYDTQAVHLRTNRMSDFGKGSLRKVISFYFKIIGVHF